MVQTRAEILLALQKAIEKREMWMQLATDTDKASKFMRAQENAEFWDKRVKDLTRDLNSIQPRKGHV